MQGNRRGKQSEIVPTIVRHALMMKTETTMPWQA